MIKEIDYRKYRYRQIGEADFKEFRAACSSSSKELTDFLNIGQYMETYTVIDHWNLFSLLCIAESMTAMDFLKEEP